MQQLRRNNCRNKIQSIMSSQSQRTPETIADMVAFFGRERSQTEVMQLIKMFKITKEEVAMQGLEKAIINRVAAKCFLYKAFL